MIELLKEKSISSKVLREKFKSASAMFDLTKVPSLTSITLSQKQNEALLIFYIGKYKVK